MRILIVTPFYAPAYSYGGIVRVAEDHARELAKRGHEVTVATTDVHDRESRNSTLQETTDGVHIRRFENISNRLANRYNLYLPRGFDRWLRENIAHYDRVIVHDNYTWLTFRTAYHARKSGVPYCFMPHGTLSDTRIALRHGFVKRFLLGKLRPYYRDAHAMLALTSQEASEIRAVEPTSRVKILGNGIDLAQVPTIERESARAKLRIEHEVFAVLFLGRLHKVKWIDIAIESFAKFHAIRPKSVFLVVGPDDGELDQLKILAEDLGISDSVRWLGILTGDAKFEAFAASDAFLFPSLNEGLPMSVIEALATSLPCILSQGCNVPEVGNAHAGIVVSGLAPDDYAVALDRISKDIPMYRANARKLAETRFSLESVIDRLEEILTVHD